jgi:hypothetical protein
LLDVVEKVKALKGVRQVAWSEVVEVIGLKVPPPQLHSHEATTEARAAAYVP